MQRDADGNDPESVLPTGWHNGGHPDKDDRELRRNEEMRKMEHGWVGVTLDLPPIWVRCDPGGKMEHKDIYHLFIYNLIIYLII